MTEDGTTSAIGTIAFTDVELSDTHTISTAANGQFLYHTGNGTLWWDDDGIGAHAAVQLATLTGAPVLTQNDFLLL